MKLAYLLPGIILGLSLQAIAQDRYPQGYFRNPLDIPILLAGNFGECRPNHFHTGLDLKTNEKENMKVYAAADGYISRISISWSGYGNALYITHPNGYTTVYGHLNDFYPELQRYLRSRQYAQEQWDLDFQLEPGQFPVTKGQFIAYSGTTGGSTGPHLHFEIRDTRTEHVLNGALFGLPVTDDIAPVAKSMALYMPGSVYDQSPEIVLLKKEGTDYVPARPVRFAEGALRIAVKADDYMEGSTNSLGVYIMKLYLDDQLQASWQLNDIDFEENRYVNAFADFSLKEKGKGWYQTLFRTPGNRLSNYTYLNKEDGSLRLDDGQVHRVHIELSDAAGNTSHIRFTTNIASQVPYAADMNCAYWEASQANEIRNATLSFLTDDNALYDNICFRYSETPSSKNYSQVVQLHSTEVPIHSYAALKIKLNKLLPFALRNKLVFVHHIKAAALPGNNPQDAAAATWDNGWARARIRTFGNYYVAVDTIPPVIRSLQKGTNLGKAKAIRFSVTDNLTSVQDFRAELDGNWLCFVRAGNTYTYIFDEHCKPGKHTLVITASDENDNKRKFSYTFSR